MQYHGYTHYFPQFLLPLWKIIFCKRGWHLWDEIYTVWDDGKHDSLYCDACGISVFLQLDNKNKPLDFFENL